MPFVNRTHRFARGLVGLWLSNEGSGDKVFDLSGNGNTGTNDDIVIDWIAGPDGSAIDFQGTNRSQTIHLANTITLLSTDRWTLTFKVQGDGDADESIFIGEFDTSDDRISLGEGNRLRFRNSADANIDFDNVTSFTNWATYSLVADGAGTLSLYIDAVLNEKKTGVTSSFVLDAIGSAYPSDTYPFDGRCSFVYLHRRDLSAGEIAELYAKPFVLFGVDNTALIASAEAPPPPTGGQVIMIQMSMIPLFLIFTLVFFIRGKES